MKVTECDDPREKSKDTVGIGRAVVTSIPTSDNGEEPGEGLCSFGDRLRERTILRFTIWFIIAAFRSFGSLAGRVLN
eukprot:1383535-Amorphochlora_amoeboformis.AAC.1